MIYIYHLNWFKSSNIKKKSSIKPYKHNSKDVSRDLVIFSRTMFLSSSTYKSTKYPTGFFPFGWGSINRLFLSWKRAAAAPHWHGGRGGGIIENYERSSVKGRKRQFHGGRKSYTVICHINSSFFFWHQKAANERFVWALKVGNLGRNRYVSNLNNYKKLCHEIKNKNKKKDY